MASAWDQSCDKITLAGFQNWAPYSVVSKEGHLQGVGVEVASQIFQNLDIPLEIHPVEKPSHLMLLLKQGDIDLLVATYDMPEVQEAVQLIEPAYFEDAIAVLVSADAPFTFERWYDLMGHTGIAVQQMQLGARFTEFSEKYLSLDYQSSLEVGLALLANHQADYLVGSAEFLRTYLLQANKTEHFKFLPHLVGPEKVYLAFARNSGCRQYAPYVTARIQTMHQDGTVDRLLQGYAIDNPASVK